MTTTDVRPPSEEGSTVTTPHSTRSVTTAPRPAPARVGWLRLTWSQVLLSQRVFWQDIAFAVIGALMPIAMGIAPVLAFRQDGSTAAATYLLPAGMAAAAMWILYNAVNSATRRRATMTYKRLRGAPLPDSAILAGEAVSAALPAVVQTVVVLVLGMRLVDAPAPQEPVVLAVGVLLAAATFALVAYGVSGLLPSAEVSTWLITPFVFALWYCSGAVTPLSTLPTWLQGVAPYLPSTAAVSLYRTAYFGQDLVGSTGPTPDAPHLDLLGTVGAVWQPVLVLLVWAVAAAVMWKRCFRWDPRRSR